MKLYTQIRWKLLLGLFKAKRIAVSILGTRRLDYSKKELRIKTSTLREYETRANSARKEPETVSWLEEEASKGGVLFDIGANIGAYSLIGASLGFETYAFEPAYQNYFTLEENVSLNKLDTAIHAFPIAFGAHTRIGSFTFLDATSGSSRGFYNEAGEYHLPIPDQVLHKDILAMKLDDCIKVFKFPIPSLIKIDVDGGELEVLEGAENTIQDPRVRSILVEVGDDKEKKACAMLISAGFSLTDQSRRNDNTKNLIFHRMQ